MSNYILNNATVFSTIVCTNDITDHSQGFCKNISSIQLSSFRFIKKEGYNNYIECNVCKPV